METTMAWINLTFPVCEENLADIAAITKAIQKNRPELVDHGWAIRFALAEVAEMIEFDPTLYDGDETDETTDELALNGGSRQDRAESPSTPVSLAAGGSVFRPARPQQLRCDAVEELECSCAVCGGPIDAEDDF